MGEEWFIVGDGKYVTVIKGRAETAKFISTTWSVKPSGREVLKSFVESEIITVYGWPGCESVESISVFDQNHGIRVMRVERPVGV